MIKTTLKIDGMMCGMCESHVNDVIRRMIPVARKVKSSARLGECTFVTEEMIDEDSIEKALKAIGYDVISIAFEPYTKRGIFG